MKRRPIFVIQLPRKLTNETRTIERLIEEATKLQQFFG
jgi:hypothetical protein